MCHLAPVTWYPSNALSEVNLINTFNPKLILMKAATGSAAPHQCPLGVGSKLSRLC